MPWQHLKRQPTSDELCEIAWARLIYFGDRCRASETAFHVVRHIIEACLTGAQL